MPEDTPEMRQLTTQMPPFSLQTPAKHPRVRAPRPPACTECGHVLWNWPGARSLPSGCGEAETLVGCGGPSAPFSVRPFCPGRLQGCSLSNQSRSPHCTPRSSVCLSFPEGWGFLPTPEGLTVLPGG